MGGVWIAVRSRVRIHDPGQAAIVADHDVRIGIVGEERREGGDALANVAAHQQAAVAVHVVAEGQLRQVAAVERDHDAAQKTAQHDAAGAFVGRQAVALRPADN